MIDTLRALVDGDRVTHALGVTDPVSALAARAAGAEVLYLSGAVASAVELARPDLGYLAASDLLAVVARIRRAVDDLPLIADADTGFGNGLGVIDTVGRYRDAGVTALHLEDQVAPKRCGHLAGKQVLDIAEATRRVDAAVRAADGDVLVIARTDAASVDGIDAALERGRRYADVGADLVFVEGVDDPAVLARLDRAVPLLVNRSEAGGPRPAPDLDALAAAGVRVLIHPVSAALAQLAAARAVYREILDDGAAAAHRPWEDYTDLLDLDAHLALGDRWT